MPSITSRPPGIRSGIGAGNESVFLNRAAIIHREADTFCIFDQVAEFLVVVLIQYKTETAFVAVLAKEAQRCA
jgi:hypothetical protein